MKKTLTTLAAMLLGTSAMAFPAHQKDGYRDTGCDPAFQVQITNAAGEYLYSNNPTCPDVGGAGFAVAAVQNDVPDEGDTPDDTGAPVDGPKPPKDKPKPGTDDNGHGNDPGKHDPSNPGKGKKNR